MATDVIPAIISVIKTATGLTRVFGEELPAAEAKSMQRPCVVVKTAGGSSRDYVTVNRTSVDIRTYGPGDPYDTRALYLTIYEALKQMEPHAEGDVWLMSAILESGPYSTRDPDASWPYTMSIWNVMSRDIAVVGS